MANSIDNTMDIIDSRDVIERLEELESDFDSLCEDLQEARNAEERNEEEVTRLTEELIDFMGSGTHADLEDAGLNFECLEEYMTDGDGAEYRALKSLAEECEGCGDWEYGETLIRESYFTEYVEELANDIGAVDTLKNNNWWIVIDWDATADNVKQDYMEVDFDGVTYLMRA